MKKTRPLRGLSGSPSGTRMLPYIAEHRKGTSAARSRSALFSPDL